MGINTRYMTTSCTIPLPIPIQTLQIVNQMNDLNKLRGGKKGPGPPFEDVLAAVEDFTSLDFWCVGVLKAINH